MEIVTVCETIYEHKRVGLHALQQDARIAIETCIFQAVRTEDDETW